MEEIKKGGLDMGFDPRVPLDAGCEPGLEMAVEVAPENIPYLVLFADVDWWDLRALRRRADEWRALFGRLDDGS